MSDSVVGSQVECEHLMINIQSSREPLTGDGRTGTPTVQRDSGTQSRMGK